MGRLPEEIGQLTPTQISTLLAAYDKVLAWDTNVNLAAATGKLDVESHPLVSREKVKSKNTVSGKDVVNRLNRASRVAR